ncbi:response regulator [Caballeronia pedi]|uniref:Response regulator n=1 Tax=Caballeronia pedi TaxID=1777141 RepID=A0A158BGX9_9BURK|nr:response regulator transcription factor [Caballeronia pedi]SAK69348.1 response regulator [Caballeronia pedi]
MSINVILAESRPLIALAIKSIIGHCSEVSLVATIRSGEDFSGLEATEECHVVVTDREALSGKPGDPINPLIKLILSQYPDIGVVLYTDIHNAAYIATLCQLGVHAVLDHDDILECLPAAIVAAYYKANYLSPSLVDAASAGTHSMRDVKPLSRCEIKVMKSVVAGLSVKQISLALCRSKQTISSHKSNAMRKLQVKSDAELYRIFSEQDFALIETTCSPSRN